MTRTERRRRSRGGLLVVLTVFATGTLGALQPSSRQAGSVDRASASTPQPGRVPLRRLNRTEYGHAIRDVLDLDVDVADLLPPDSASYGFDNIAGALSVSPALLERYVASARRVSALALGRVTDPETSTITPPADRSQDQPLDGMPIGTHGGLLVSHYFPVDAEYVFRAQVWETNAGGTRGMEGYESPFELELSIDGAPAHRALLGGTQDDALSSTSAGAGIAAANARLQGRTRVRAGRHAVLVTFLKPTSASTQEVLQPLRRTSLDPFDGYGAPRLAHLTIAGPFNPTGPGDTPSRRRILICRPASGDNPHACARAILAAVARRAYRRPVTDDDLDALLDLFDRGRDGVSYGGVSDSVVSSGGLSSGGASDDRFDAGIAAAIARVLSGPEFLFRAEHTATGIGASDGARRLDDLTLASRLSFFLWSSIPDDDLLRLGEEGALRDPSILERQVARLLADPRAGSLSTDFAGQWLHLRNLESAHPDLLEFPDWDDNLRQGFRRETELLFDSIVREDRSVLDLLTADYTFLNERLAKHYGIAGVYGPWFRRVTVTDANRRGLLGHGSILTVTSTPTRTSPVLRGKWILSEILNAPPPPPPPGVANALPERGDQGRTGREQMEDHRRNPVCASCHETMDPIGFALENFDATGGWRASDDGRPIDASGVLADGTRVDGPAALRTAIAAKPEVFVSTLTEKLMTYALGRGVEPYDLPAIRSIVHDAAGTQYRFSSLVRGIVGSAAFQMTGAEGRP